MIAINKGLSKLINPPNFKVIVRILTVLCQVVCLTVPVVVMYLSHVEDVMLGIVFHCSS